MVKFLRKEYEYKAKMTKRVKYIRKRWFKIPMKGIRVKIETLMCKQKYICKSVNTPMGKIRTGTLMSC